MRKVLAITVALMIAAIVSMPALGFTNQIAGNQSYTATSGARVGYSIALGAPGHNLTQDMATSESPVSTPAVQSTRVAYSIKQGTVMPYSVSLVDVMGEQTKAPVVLGSAANTTEASMPATETVAPAANVTPETVAPVANVTAAPEVVVPGVTIEGMAFNDTDGNSTMDNNETVLADWTVNLEQPAGNVIMSVNTSMDGKFAFSDLAAGDYVISEVLKMGWRIVSPSDGKFSVNITDTSVTGLVFANQIMPIEAGNETVMPVEAENVTVVPIEAENVTTPGDDTALIDATVA
jgi:hypothetical protein